MSDKLFNITEFDVPGILTALDLSQYFNLLELGGSRDQLAQLELSQSLNRARFSRHFGASQ
jgi:hypothetical protein